MEGTKSFVIQTKGLSKEYKDTKALYTLNLQVPQNSIFGFLGPNGAGKSTIIFIIVAVWRFGREELKA